MRREDEWVPHETPEVIVCGGGDGGHGLAVAQGGDGYGGVGRSFTANGVAAEPDEEGGVELMMHLSGHVRTTRLSSP